MSASPEIATNELSNHFFIDAQNLQNTDPLASRINLGFAQFMTDPNHSNWLMELREAKLSSGAYSPGHNVRHLRYLFHKLLLEQNPLVHPANFPDANECASILTETYHDQSLRLNFELDHMIYNPMTTKPGRYYAALLAAGLLLPSQDSYRVMDFGSGDNSGIALMHIASNELPRRVLGEVLPSTPTLDSATSVHQPLLDEIFTKTEEKPMTDSWGLDISHPCDFTVRSYSRVCGPTKLLFDDAHKDMKTTLFSHAITSPDLKFARFDTTKSSFYLYSPIEGGKYVVSDGRSYPFINDPLPTEQVDIVTSMYMLYMHPPEKRQVIFDNMRNLGRIILIFDAIDGLSDKPADSPIDQLFFSKDWPDYSTQAIAYDQENPHLGWQSIARSKEGDFAVIKPGKLLIDGLQKASQMLTH